MKVRLTSPKGEPREGFIPMGVHVPGLIRWAKAGYHGKDKTMVNLISQSFGLKREVALAILTGEIEAMVEGDDVLIDWPDNPLLEGDT